MEFHNPIHTIFTEIVNPSQNALSKSICVILENASQGGLTNLVPSKMGRTNGQDTRHSRSVTNLQKWGQTCMPVPIYVTPNCS